MRQGLVVCLMVWGFASSMASAAAPIYLPSKIRGSYIADIFNRGTAEISSGTLSKCTTKFDDGQYIRNVCELSSAEGTFGLAGKTLAFTFYEVDISEYRFDPKQPAIIEYALKANYQETQPDGSVWRAKVLVVVRPDDKFENFKGSLQMSGVSATGLLVGKKI